MKKLKSQIFAVFSFFYVFRYRDIKIKKIPSMVLKMVIEIVFHMKKRYNNGVLVGKWGDSD